MRLPPGAPSQAGRGMPCDARKGFPRQPRLGFEERRGADITGTICVDRHIAHRAVLETCLRLRAGKEARLDRNVLRSAFPAGLDDRPVETQLFELLQAANDGIFTCRAIPGGDCVVRRCVRKALLPDPTVIGMIDAVIAAAKPFTGRPDRGDSPSVLGWTLASP